MPTFANVTPTAPNEGTVYTAGTPLTAQEAVLGDGLEVADGIIPIVEGQTIVAVVRLSLNGIVGANNTYVFLQTDLGDGVWVDVAWCQWIGKQGSATFVLCGGGLGQMNNAFQAGRQSGSAPATQGNGSNAVPLGARCRITGHQSFSSGSSSLAGSATAVTATIRYKLQTPR